MNEDWTILLRNTGIYMTELTNHRATRTRDRNRDQGTISGSICVYFKYENEGFLYTYVINNKII